MTPSQDRIAALQTELAGMSGPARCPRLLMLGQALMDRYWRTGPGSQAGLPDLNAAIEAMEEAYGYLESGDQHRGLVANGLGWIRGARHMMHGGDVADRNTAIRLLEESLSCPILPPVNAASGRLVLGQLYLLEAMQGMQAMGLNLASLGGGAAPERKAAERAVEHIRQVAEAPSVSAEVTSAARSMLTMAETTRDLLEGLSGGPLGLDLGRMQRLITTLQTLQAQAKSMSGMSGYGRMAGFSAGGGAPFAPGGAAPGQSGLPPLPLFDIEAMAAEPPLDRPVTVIEGQEPAAPAVAPKPRPAAVPANVERLRAALAAQFAQLAATVAEPTDVVQPVAKPMTGDPTVEDRPARDRTVEPPEAYRSAAALLCPDGPPLPVDAVDECVALATTVVHEVESIDPAGAGLDRFLLAVALFLRARGDVDAREGDGWADGDGWGDPAGEGWGEAGTGPWADGAGSDLAAGLDSLLRAAETLPPEHPAAIAVLTGLTAFLDYRQPLRSLAGDTARRFAERADAVAAAHAGTDSDLATVRAVGAVCRAAVAMRSSSFGDTADSADGTADPANGADPVDGTDLDAEVAAVPEGHPWRFRLRTAAGVTAVAAALGRQDPAALRSAAASLAEAVTSAPAQYARAPGWRVLARLAAVLGALGGGDPVALRTATDRLAEVSDARTADPGEAIRIHALLGGLRLLLHGAEDVNGAGDGDARPAVDPAAGADDERLTSAIESLKVAATQLADDPDAVLRSGSWWRLAEAYRRRGTVADRDQSRLAALRALRGAGQDAADALRFAGWMLDGGGAYEAFEALEVAALAEHEPIDPLVRDVARVLLGPGVAAGPPVPSPRRPPAVGEVAAALRTIGAAGLVYLHAVPGRPHGVGVLLLDASTERLDLLGTVDVPDLAADAPPVGWPDRTWDALVEPLLAMTTTAAMTDATTTVAGARPRRLLVAATGALGRLPLPAIRTGTGGYAADDLVVSSVRSGRQVVRLAQRTPLPVPDDVVFVANPRGDRDSATFEAMTLRRIFHPRSTGLGRTVEQVHGAGTPADVLAHLPGPAGPGASLLHLGCALQTAGSPGLELADSAVLDVARIAVQARAAPHWDSGGLAILPADAGAHHERWMSFADALLHAGLTGVIGWLWPVPEHVATLMLLVLHGKLVDDGLPPATAVREVHRWMLDPHRVPPPYLPASQVAALGGTDLTDPRYWAALCHRGR